jgi:hypothetical protein
MLRVSILILYFLFSLLGAQPVIAQSYSSLPSRIMVSSSARTLKIGQLTEIRITLIDQQGQEVAAVENTPMTLIGTKLKDLSSAKGAAHESRALHDGLLELPPGGISTVQGSFTIPRGQNGATVRFKSQQSGTIRIFAESEKLVAGSTLIAVLREGTGRSAAQTSAFQTVSFQEESALPSYALALEADGSEIPPIINREWVRKINVLLNSNGELVPAVEPIEVRLRIEGGTATLSDTTIIIPPGEASSAPVELRTTVGGEIKVSARAVRKGQLLIASTLSPIPFPKARQATKLLVDALPPAALANGLEAIQLRVRAVDEGNNPIRAEDEGLSAREVIFRLEGKAFGLKFDKGVTKVTIPKDEVAAVINIFGSSPIDGTKVIAESENGFGIAINGATKVAFSFPWWQLGWAIFGGLLVLPLHELTKSYREGRQHTRTDLVKKGAKGVFWGGICFILIFFGAAAMDNLNLSGITINLTRLPLHNVVAAFAIGSLGSLLIDNRSVITSGIARTMGRLKPASA